LGYALDYPRATASRRALKCSQVWLACAIGAKIYQLRSHKLLHNAPQHNGLFSAMILFAVELRIKQVRRMSNFSHPSVRQGIQKKTP
jgi:hypothetical protein